MPPRGEQLVCANCGRSIPWRSDEAGEWPVVEEGGAFRTLCFECYRTRFGEDESSQDSERTRAEQSDERR